MIDVADIAEQLEGWFGTAKADAERYRTDAENFLAIHAPGLRVVADATADDLGKLALGMGEVVVPPELRPVVADLVTKFVQAYLSKPEPAPAPEPEPAPEPVDPTAP